MSESVVASDGAGTAVGSEAAAGSEGAASSEGAVGSEAAIRDAAARIAALGESSPRPAPDPVNLPMIRHWVQAMGDTNPVYTDAGVAPPAMTQVWTMRGLRPAGREDPGDPLGGLPDRDRGVVGCHHALTFTWGPGAGRAPPSRSARAGFR